MGLTQYEQAVITGTVMKLIDLMLSTRGDPVDQMLALYEYGVYVTVFASKLMEERKAQDLHRLVPPI